MHFACRGIDLQHSAGTLLLGQSMGGFQTQIMHHKTISSKIMCTQILFTITYHNMIIYYMDMLSMLAAGSK